MNSLVARVQTTCPKPPWQCRKRAAIIRVGFSVNETQKRRHISYTKNVLVCPSACLSVCMYCVHLYRHAYIFSIIMHGYMHARTCRHTLSHTHAHRQSPCIWDGQAPREPPDPWKEVRRPAVLRKGLVTNWSTERHRSITEVLSSHLFSVSCININTYIYICT